MPVTTRGELDPAAAQRIVAITGDGDEGLKALQACQAYVREIGGVGEDSRLIAKRRFYPERMAAQAVMEEKRRLKRQ